MSERSTKEIHEAALGSAEKKEKNSLKIPGRNFRRMPGTTKSDGSSNEDDHLEDKSESQEQAILVVRNDNAAENSCNAR
ncbi:hypothetical protein AAC387_Pa10g1251 [Persea americana]